VEASLDLPSVMIALERSFSMLQPWGARSSRKQIAYEAVQDVVGSYDRAIKFGLEQFPAPDGVCGSTNAMCCAGVVGKNGPARGFADKLREALRCDLQGCPDNPAWPASIPTADALHISRLYYDTVQGGRAPRYVLLVTDGDPSCANMNSACEAAETEASALATQADVHTLVLGIGEDARASTCLDRLAQAGGEPRSAAPRFFLAERPDDLWATLHSLMAGIAAEPCRLQLGGPVADGAVLQIGPAFKERDPSRVDGWDYDGERLDRVLVFGPACAALKATLQRVPVAVCPRDKP
jgi:hypothetical protein